MTKYSVQKGNSKLLDEFRGDRIYGDVYVITKDGAPHYEVVVATLGEWCNCKGFVNHGNCKHIKMAQDYRAEFEL
jgi:hypothetical protein